MIELIGYKTNLGLFIKRVSNGYYNVGMNGVRINGLTDFPKVGADYYFLKDVNEITSVEVYQAAEKKFIGLGLKIESIANDKIPVFLPVGSYTKFDGEYLEGEYEGLDSLYENKYETLEPKWIVDEFKFTLIRELEVDGFEKPSEMKVKVIHDTYGNKQSEVDLSSIVVYSDFEKMLTPEFLLHDRPCSISRDNVYKIVRAHVINNIDNRYAMITSNYDFCFTVKKKVSIKPIHTSKEIKKANGRSYATPKFQNTVTTHKDIEIFNMAPKAYQNYIVIEGWTANSLVEMKEQIGQYLKELMDYINTPFSECEQCNGSGHIINKDFNVNQR